MNETGVKEPRMWETAWTPDEIRKNSANWTLAGDAGLLNGMQSLAQTLLMKTQEIQKEVDSLGQETRATSSRMHNAITDFLMLSNVQFVENRVYDEEIQEENLNNDNKTAVQKKSKEEREAELLPKVREAVKFGLNVVENAFEKHEVIDSDSEEEEDNSFHALPVLKPKDFYSHRPLPYVIGSEKFMRDDYAGLEEVPSDEDEESEKEEVDELQEDESKDLSGESTEDSDFDATDAESRTKEDKPRVISGQLNERKNDESDEDGELFPAEASEDGFSSEDDANSNTGDPQVATAPANFAAELAAKLGVSQQAPLHKEKSEKKEEKEQKIDDSKHTKRRESKSKDKEDTHPPEIPEQISDDEEDSFFTRKDTLFGSGGGLFDDLSQDDENDLFSEVKSKPLAKKEVTTRKESKLEIEIRAKKKSASIFDDVEDDLFSSVKMADEAKIKKSTSVAKRSSIDESDSVERKNQRAASLFCDADDEDDDLFSSSTRKKTKSIHVEKDDDLFTPKEHSASSSEGTPKKKLPAGAVSIFGSATNPMQELLKAHRHFSESEKEETDSEWSTPEKTIKPTAKEEPTPKKTENPDTTTDVLAGGDTPNLNPEKPPKETPSPTRPARAISLFDDDNDDDVDDLFSNVKTKPEVAKEKTKEPKAPAIQDLSSDSSKTSSLFDAEEDAGDDIFQKKLEASPKLRTTSLFDDEDILFGGPSEDAPSVDLFKNPENVEETAETPKDGGGDAEERRKSLFDLTEDEEDLFSTSNTPKSAKSASVPIPAVRKSSALKEEAISSKEEAISSKEEAILAKGDAVSAKVEGSPTRKKPVGGISLFGGIDPFAGKAKKEGATEVGLSCEKKSESEDNVLAQKKVAEPILPGISLKAVTPSVEVGVSFEEPVGPNTLKSTCKNRATVQKRRPPTRKGRKTQAPSRIEVDVAEKPSDDIANTLSPSTEEEDVFPADELAQPNSSPDFNRPNGQPKHEEEEKKKVDLFANLDTKLDEDDIFALPKKTKPVLSPDDDDDLFSSASKPVEKSVEKAVKKDLFGGMKKKTVASLFDDDSEDDIFASKTSTAAKPVAKPAASKKSKGLFDDDDDDVSIFDDPLMVKRGNL